MIQQIVDENGTLRHIILSALNSNGTGSNCYSNSTFATHQPQSQAPSQNGQSGYCCCCYQTCGPVGNGQTGLTSAGTLPATALQAAPLGHSPVSFPLSNSYARHRRTNRTFASPSSGKRPPGSGHYNGTSGGYYGNGGVPATPAVHSASNSKEYIKVNHIGASTGARYGKSDNPKSNHYGNRQSSNLHYESSTRPFNETANETKYYLNKSYDYSCNSSNASQTSTLDQASDNLKYYKEEEEETVNSFRIETHLPQKSSKAEKTKESISSFYLSHQPTVVSDQEDHSQESSQGECPDSNNSQLFSGKDGTNLANQQRNSPGELTDDLVSLKSGPALPPRDVDSRRLVSKTNADSPKSRRLLKGSLPSLPKDPERPHQDSSPKVTPPTTTKHDPSIANGDTSHIEPRKVVSVGPNETDRYSCDADNSELAMDQGGQTKPLANGNRELPSGELGHSDYVIMADDNDSERSYSEADADEDSYHLHRISVNPPLRSPRHLLPKIEAISLVYVVQTSHSVRLKWCIAQQGHEVNELEPKKLFIVDMLRGNIEDSPSTKIVYQGSNGTCRVSHLQPQKEYTFRVRLNTETAVLTSNLLTVFTPEPASSGLKGRRTKQQQLQPGGHLQPPAHTVGAPGTSQFAPELAPASATGPTASEVLMQAHLSRDKRCAMLILLAFTAMALVISVLVQQMLYPN